MTPQEQLTAKIREALPHLMELKEGCIVSLKEEYYPIKMYLKTNISYKFFDKSGDIYIFSEKTINKDFTIIGAEPTLNDVLMYCFIKGFHFSRHEDIEGYKIMFTNCDLDRGYYNLQLPYSQQSDKWFNFMLGL